MLLHLYVVFIGDYGTPVVESNQNICIQIALSARASWYWRTVRKARMRTPTMGISSRTSR